MLNNERVYARINLDNIKENIININNNIKADTKILAVIKADGYGHGSVRISKELETLDCIFGYAVATIEEALEVKNAGAKKPILILGYSFQKSFEAIIENDIRSTVFEIETANLLNEVAKKLGKIAKVHLKVDTGMSRIGMQPDDDGLSIVDEISKMSNIEIEGIFTHFARADEYDKTHVLKQLKLFTDFTNRIEALGINIPFKHCSNSAGIIELKEANMNLVRAGIIMYGLWPSDEVSKDIIDLKPAMELKSTIVFIKDVEPGRQISYGGTFVVKEPMRIATVSVGYADGYPRCLSNKGYVLVRGKKAPIVGRVCMDQVMIDVTNISDASRGDTVTLIGEDNGEYLSMDEFSILSDRINYESVCDIGKRVPRIYIKNGELE